MASEHPHHTNAITSEVEEKPTVNHVDSGSTGDSQSIVHVTDTETDEENATTLPPLEVPVWDTESIEISISHVQNEMKSPVTPAATKFLAIDSAKDYFIAEPDSEISPLDGGPADPSSVDTRVSVQQPSTHIPALDGVPSTAASPGQPPGAEEKQNKRSSLVGSIMNSVNMNRSRSSSGSSLFENFKKYLPELPALTTPRFIEVANTRPRSQTLRGAETAPSRHLSDQSPVDHLRNEDKFTEPRSQTPDPKHGSISRFTSTGTDNAETNPERSKQGLLRRATSDQSLYLRRAPTGASEFDNYNNWTNVTEMVNSRYKAITDSFQDSSLKLPKIPSINFGSSRSTPPETISETRNNTNVNRHSSGGSVDPQYDKDKVNVIHAREKQHPILTDALSRLHGDLILLGGYRGSVLREAKSPNRQLWVPVKVGLNLRKADLEVGLTREDELTMEEKIIPDGILSHIGPVDISRRLVRKCKKCRNVAEEKLRFHNYGYDWRLSPDLLSDRFIRFVEQLPCNSRKQPKEKRGVWVIAHSLGGLITRHAINLRPELFAGVVYAGTPQNCVNILGPLRNGDDVLFSSRVLTAQVNFTLRTSFLLLPQNGRCFVNKQNGERYDVDFFDVKTWEEYCLSPCIKPPIPRKPPDKRQSLVDSISETISTRFGSTSHGSEPTPSPMQQMKNQAEDARDNLESIAEDFDPKPNNPVAANLSLNTQSSVHKPTIATSCTIPLPAATEYLSRTLTSVRKFKEGLAYNPLLQHQNSYPPVSVLFAKTTPTVYGAFVKSREAIKYDDAYDDLAFAAGDGVVLASAAQLPPGYRCVKNGRVETDRGHVGLLGDLEAVGKCLNAVIDARVRGVGIGAYENESQNYVDLHNQAAPSSPAPVNEDLKRTQSPIALSVG